MKRVLLLVAVLLATASPAFAQRMLYQPRLSWSQVPWSVAVSAVQTDSMQVLIGGSALKADTSEAISLADVARGVWRSTIPSSMFLKFAVSGDAAIGTIDSLFFTYQVSLDGGTTWVGSSGAATLVTLAPTQSATMGAGVASTVYTNQAPINMDPSSGVLDGQAGEAFMRVPLCRVIVTSNVASKKLTNAKLWWGSFRNRP